MLAPWPNQFRGAKNSAKNREKLVVGPQHTRKIYENMGSRFVDTEIIQACLYGPFKPTPLTTQTSVVRATGKRLQF